MSPARTRPRALLFAALTAVLVAAAVWTPSGDGLPLCALRLAAGVPCPGCGMTRAVAALFKGDLAASARFHLFAPVVAGGMALAWLALAAGFATNRDFLPDLNGRRAAIAFIGFGAAFAGYWIYRLAAGTIP